jgi:hypothetical protein
MSTVRLDSLAAQIQAAYHCDASEATVFARQLLRVRAGLFEQQYPELKAMRLIPRADGISPTDEQYTYQHVVEYGATKFATSYSEDAPRADVSFVEATPQSIKPFMASYGYNFHEARIAAALNTGLPMRKAEAARKAMAFKMDDILATGGTAAEFGVALPGLISASGTHTYTVPNGAGGSKAWVNKTPDEILADMHGIASGIVTNSNSVEVPDTLLLPLEEYELVSRVRLGDGSDTTILRHFEATNPHIKTVESWWRLDSVSGVAGSGARMICYKKDPTVLESLVPIEFEQLAPQIKGVETVTTCHARVGGVVLYRPKAISFGDEI